MKIEKINDNKLKIVLTKQDLIDKHIDIKNLNPNSMESQNLFFDLLQEIESYHDFDLEDSQILLEGVSTANGSMILTITKRNDDFIETKKSPKLIVKKKKENTNLANTEFIYKFDNLDTFIDFSSSIKTLPKRYINTLYKLKENYYLTLKIANIKEDSYKNVFLQLSDYAETMPYNNYKEKLTEYGEIIIKNSAIQKINNSHK